MAKKPKLTTEGVAEPGDEAVAEVSASEPELPPGNPLTWTVEQWLIAQGVPVSKMSDELARLAAQNGVAGLPWQALLNIWMANTSPSQLEAGTRFILDGLVALAVSGHGPSGHAGAELA